MKPAGLDHDFFIIGENIHTTRVVLLKGKLVDQLPGGEEAVRYTDAEGQVRHLVIPESMKSRQDYQEGRVKHVMIAVRQAMAGDEEGLRYLRALIHRQIEAGSDFLDLNVDEISLKLNDQIEAIEWLVRMVETHSSVPVAVDSSNLDIIRAGIAASQARCGPPMLNSASLERMEALDLAASRGLAVMVTAAGERGMPQDAAERVANASRMVDAALTKGIAKHQIYIDPLVFPIAVDSQYGLHCLDAIRTLREKYGPEIHISGGLSNVSFGIPVRKLVNEAFIHLAVEAGADGGIVDPVANNFHQLFLADKTTRPYQLAVDMLLGRDRNCKAYLRAYRKGELG
ncbi:MAG: dihydropteroate synthase [Bryobacterales bacterium]|nr:dihydropteroate synthase [Bryobacterales bacterium]